MKTNINKKRKIKGHIILIILVIITFTSYLAFYSASVISSSGVVDSLVYESPKTTTPSYTPELEPQWSLPANIVISEDYIQTAGINNVPQFIKRGEAFLTRQNGERIKLFSLDSDEYFTDNTLTTFLPEMDGGTYQTESFLLEFLIEDSDGEVYMESREAEVSFEEAEDGGSPYLENAEEWCRCKDIKLIASQGGDAAPTKEDTADFGKTPDDLKVQYYPNRRALQLGFIIKATCSASSETALLNLCLEGQEVKSTVKATWDDGSTDVYCKRATFNPKKPIVPPNNRDARCYDPSREKSDPTKVAQCMGRTPDGKPATSPGFGDDDFHNPHKDSNGRWVKVHKRLPNGDWLVKWIDFPGIIIPTLSPDKSKLGVSSEFDAYYHAYVIGQDCPQTKKCNKCFVIKGKLDDSEEDIKKTGSKLEIQKVDCKFVDDASGEK